MPYLSLLEILSPFTLLIFKLDLKECENTFSKLSNQWEQAVNQKIHAHNS